MICTLVDDPYLLNANNKRLDSVYMGQGNIIQFVRSLIFFQDFLFLLSLLFGRIESLDVAGVLQEARDTDSRVCTIISYTSTSIRLPHLGQRYHDHWVVTTNDGRMGRLVCGSFMLGFGWGHWERVSFFWDAVNIPVINCRFYVYDQTFKKYEFVKNLINNESRFHEILTVF